MKDAWNKDATRKKNQAAANLKAIETGWYYSEGGRRFMRDWFLAGSRSVLNKWLRRTRRAWRTEDVGVPLKDIPSGYSRRNSVIYMTRAVGASRDTDTAPHLASQGHTIRPIRFDSWNWDATIFFPLEHAILCRRRTRAITNIGISVFGLRYHVSGILL